MKSRNLMPVTVWKHVRRKRSVSRTSRPVLGEEGFGRVKPAGDAVELFVEGAAGGTWGVKERVIAWTLELL